MSDSTDNGSAPHAADEDDAPPTWDDMREDGAMVIDNPHDKLAVYVGGAGHVVIMSQGLAEDAPHFHTVHCADVSKLIDALRDAMPDAQEQERLFDEQCEQAERDYAAWLAAGGDQSMSDEEIRIHGLWGRLGALSANISKLAKQISGESPIARSTLVMAEADGRNHLADLIAKHALAVRQRLALADELTLVSKRPPRYAEYLAAVQQLDQQGN